MDGFENYVIETKATPDFLLIIFVAYAAFSFLLVGLVIAVRRKRRGPLSSPCFESSSVVPEINTTETENNVIRLNSIQNAQTQRCMPVIAPPSAPSSNGPTTVHTGDAVLDGKQPRKEQELVALDRFLPPQNKVSTPISQPFENDDVLHSPLDALEPSLSHPNTADGARPFHPPSADQVSAVPSAATTTILREKGRVSRARHLAVGNSENRSVGQVVEHNNLPPTSSHSKGPASASTSKRHMSGRFIPSLSAVLDPNSMRRRPVGRVDSLDRSIRADQQVHDSDDSESQGVASRSRVSWSGGSRVPSHRGMSDVASQKLDAEVVEGEADFYRQRYIQRVAQNRLRASVAMSERSALPPLSPDVLSPEDAADAHDVGYLNNTEEFIGESEVGYFFLSRCPAPLQCFLEVAEPDYDTHRIARMALGPTIGAFSEPLFRLVLVAIISHYIGTDAMVAFVLVTLFVRLTMENLSAAITDTESVWLGRALSLGGDEGFFGAGQHLQMAIFMQLFVLGPVLVVWALKMDRLVWWLLKREQIADQASQYTQIIVVDYMLQALSRTFMLAVHFLGRKQFETNIDICWALATLTVIALFVAISNEPTLTSMAWIQVIGSATCISVKVVFVQMNGWLRPFRKGLFNQCSLAVSENLLYWNKLYQPSFLTSFLCPELVDCFEFSFEHISFIFGVACRAPRSKLFVSVLVRQTLQAPLIYTFICKWELLTLFVRELGAAEGMMLLVISYVFLFSNFITSMWFLFPAVCKLVLGQLWA
jgi:hypothetical protein